LPEGATTTINQLTQGKSTERQVVESVGNWVATTMHYDATKGVEPYVDASYAFDNHAGTCRGYDSLMTGILRKLGIPVRTVNGWVTPQKLNLPGPRGGSSYVQWSIPGTAGELHTWIEIWFPDAGWVPFDPQREKFFVDVRHFPFFLSNDSGDQQIGAWTADTQDGQNSDGPLLPQGGTEIVPGDGINSKVTLNLSSGNVHIVAQGFHRDVHTLFMFEG
jgi:hypothetical protein